MARLTPEEYGLRCVKTHTTKGPFVDLGTLVPVPYLDSGQSRLALSEPVAREVADAIGWASPDVLQALEGALLDANAKIRGLEEQLEEAKANQTLVVSLDDVISALPERAA